MDASPETELAIGPFINWFNPKCADIWSSPSCGQQTSDGVKSGVVGYYVYGARNRVVVCRLEGMRLHFLKSIAAYSNIKVNVTTVAFSRNLEEAVLFMGSSEGQPLVYDLLSGQIHEEPTKHLDKRLLHKKITCAQWSDAENVFYSIDKLVVHWNVKTGLIEHIKMNAQEQGSSGSQITCITISPRAPYFIAVGFERGDIALMPLVLPKMKENQRILWLLNHKNDICSLAFSWEPAGYKEGVLASVSRDGIINVWDICLSKSILYHITDCEKSYQNKKQMQNKNKNFFVVAFLPSVDYNQANYTPTAAVTEPRDESESEKDFYYFQLLFSTFNGEVMKILVPKFPPSKAVNRPLIDKFDRQKKHNHYNVIFSMSVSGPYGGGPLDPEGGWLSSDTEQCPRIAVSSSLDRQVIVWDLNLGKAQTTFQTLSQQVKGIAFNPYDPHWAAIGGGEGLRLWRMSDLTQLSNDTINQHDIVNVRKNFTLNCKLTAVAWHPQLCHQIAAATDDGQIYVLDVETSKPQKVYTYDDVGRDKSQIYTAVWGPLPSDSNSSPTWALYCIESGGKLKLHVPSTSKVLNFGEVSNCMGQSLKKSEVAWREDWRFLAVGYESGTVEIYANQPTRSTLILVVVLDKMHNKLIECIQWHPMFLSAYNPDSRVTAKDGLSEYQFWLASASDEEVIRVVDLTETFKQIDEDPEPGSFPQLLSKSTVCFVGHDSRVISLAWSILKEGSLVSCSYDNTARVWDLKSKSCVALFSGHWSKLFTIAWCPFDADLVISAGDDNTLQIWRPSKQTDHCQAEENGKELDAVDGEDTEAVRQMLMERINEKRREISAQLEKNAKEAGDQRTNAETSWRSNVDRREDTTKTRSRVQAIRSFAQKTESIKSQPKSHLLFSDCRTDGASNVDEDIEWILKQNSDSPQPLQVPPEVQKRINIYGDADAVEKAVVAEADILVQRNNLDLAMQLKAFQDVEKTVEEAGHQRQLTDWLVAVSASVSRAFYCKTVQLYSKQLEIEGKPLLAAQYLVALNKEREAIRLLMSHKMYPEALLLAKLKFPVKSEAVTELIKEAADCYKKAGSDAEAAKWLASIGCRDKSPSPVLSPPHSHHNGIKSPETQETLAVVSNGERCEESTDKQNTNET